MTGAGTGSSFTLGVDETKLTLSNIGGSVTDAQVPNDITITAAGGWADGGSNIYQSTTTDNVAIGTTAPTASLLIENLSTGDSFRVNDSAIDANPFIITSSGNVGIGTFTSTSNLTIVSAANSTTPVAMTFNSLGSANGVSLSSSSTSVTGSQAILAILASGVSGQLGGLQIDSRGGPTGFGLKVLDVSGDTTPFYIDNTGSVGIGTASPTAQLDLRYQASTVPFKIGNSATDSAGAYMIVNSSGNVGIGTTTPQQKLQVVGTVTATDNIGIGTTLPNANLDLKGAGPIIRLNSTDTTTNTFTKYGNSNANDQIEFGLEGTTEDFRINHSGNHNMWLGTNDTVRVFINNNGNVGIGSSAPNSILNIPSLKSTTGTRYLCIGTTGIITSSATACSGT